jgi:micrococcal nuclease
MAKNRKTSGRPESQLTLNGVPTRIIWSDGDSFRIKDGLWAGRGTRLQGYNTLETFGPVHQWGTWTAAELFLIAKKAGELAASKSWMCTTDGTFDRYQRLLVNCPALTNFLVSEGVALVYAVEGITAEISLLKQQKEAQQAGRGMWQKGVVLGVVTSVHSADEEKLESGVYNRVVDTQTGSALQRVHAHRYATCENVCEETAGQQSCLVYVPFRLRYHSKPTCLKGL